MGIRVLSLFDGMSCGQIALCRAGIKVDAYYASEVDKHAIKVTQSNWPLTIHLGDVMAWKEWDIDWASIDLLIGGSPCQGFSYSGKRLAFDDPRSKLFFVYVEILRHIQNYNPNIKFLLENVLMKRDFLDVITAHLGVEPVFINSSLVSAQNRQRYYWANWDIESPQDKEIFLSDILESDKHFNSATIVGRKLDENGKRNDKLSIKPVQCLEVHSHGKSRCLSTVAKDAVISPLPVGRYPLSKEYRNLTITECERLQTLSDGYTQAVSDSQRRKMIGNGWTVDVIVHILNHLTNEKVGLINSENSKSKRS